MSNALLTENPFLVAEIQELYRKNINVSEYLRNRLGESRNSAEVIELAYDAQAGSYVAAMANEETDSFKRRYAHAITDVFRKLGKASSIMEAGVGEATTLGYVASEIGADTQFYGFDISWSRVVHANNWLQRISAPPAELCVGDLLEIPFADNAIDIVYTSHSIEPNGGRERDILAELLRVTRDYLVLLEPAHDLASPEARERMERHGYCRNLPEHIEALGYEMLEHRLFDHAINPLNPTGLTIIAKKAGTLPLPATVYRCPLTHTGMTKAHNMFFSEEALIGYPVAGGVPCLRSRNAIVCSAMDQLPEV